MANLSYKNVQYGRTRVRRNYARVQTNVELPNLIEIQTKSFDWFMKDGLSALFKELSPIKDHGDGEKFELHFKEHEFDEPKYSIRDAKIHKVNYSRALRVNVELENKETGEFKDDKIFMGEIPVMTPWGTFIINGSERVVVTQIVRSAGVFFSEEIDKNQANLSLRVKLSQRVVFGLNLKRTTKMFGLQKSTVQKKYASLLLSVL